jgi:hypothetical protein
MLARSVVAVLLVIIASLASSPVSNAKADHFPLVPRPDLSNVPICVPNQETGIVELESS